jgi:hypothetical protein
MENFDVYNIKGKELVLVKNAANSAVLIDPNSDYLGSMSSLTHVSEAYGLNPIRKATQQEVKAVVLRYEYVTRETFQEFLAEKKDEEASSDESCLDF